MDALFFNNVLFIIYLILCVNLSKIKYFNVKEECSEDDDQHFKAWIEF